MGDYRTCTYAWTVTDRGEWGEQCASTTRPVTAVCQRSTGETVLDDFCGEGKPQTEDGFNAAGCSYDWKVAEWSSWSSTCSPTAERSRNVVCVRQDGADVGDASCGSAPKPAARETSAIEYGCNTGLTFNWGASDWSEWSSQCSDSAIRTRTVQCRRSDDTPSVDANCTAERPSESEIGVIRTGCEPGDGGPGGDGGGTLTYDWTVGNWSAPDEPMCGDYVRTRTVACVSNRGVVVDDGMCDATRPASSETIYDGSGCGYAWSASAFTWSSECSDAAIGTRSVTCMRNGTEVVEDARCGANRPETTSQEARYEGCTTDWAVGEWGGWSSQCSAQSTRSRSVACMQQRPSGAVSRPSDSCSNTPPESSETTRNFTNCTASWDIGAWGWNGVADAKSSTCSAAPTQNRTVACMKTDSTGQRVAVDEDQCIADGAGPRPEATRTVTSDYSSCSYAWSPNDTTTGWGWNGQEGAWSNTCSANAQQTRTVSCIRSGLSGGATEIVGDGMCANAGAKPQTGRTASNVSGCQNVLGDYGFESGAILASPANGRYSTNAGNSTVSTDAYEGRYSARLPGYSAIYQQMDVTAGVYTASFVCKGNNRLNFGVNYPGGGGTSAVVTCGTAWTLVNVDFNFPTSGRTNVSIWAQFGGADTFIDNITLYRR